MISKFNLITYMFLSIFLVYLQVITAATFLINYLVMSVNYLSLDTYEVSAYFFGGFVIAAIWNIVSLRRITRGHLYIVEEVAVIIYPIGVAIALLISGGLAYFTYLLNGMNDKVYFLNVVCGLTVAGFIGIKSLDIRFMRSLDELTDEYEMTEE